MDPTALRESGGGAAAENEPMLGAGGRRSFNSDDDERTSSDRYRDYDERDSDLEEKGTASPSSAANQGRSKFAKIAALVCGFLVILLAGFVLHQLFQPRDSAPSGEASTESGQAQQQQGQLTASDAVSSVLSSAAAAEKPAPATTSVSSASSASPSPADSDETAEEDAGDNDDDHMSPGGIAGISLPDQLNLKTGFVVSSTPATREYEFNITRQLGAPDGYQKSMILVNGQSPGPLIEANTGDTIRVVVHNNMPEASTTVHWHGINQRNSTWMDGVFGVSQCGIPPGESFTYEFQVPDQRGTFWYHSHVSVQYTDGLYGPLIIHDPEEMILDVDDDKILMIGDLYHGQAEDILADYLSDSPSYGHMPGLEPPPDNIIMNGMHVSQCSPPGEEGEDGHGHSHSHSHSHGDAHDEGMGEQHSEEDEEGHHHGGEGMEEAPHRDSHSGGDGHDHSGMNMNMGEGDDHDHDHDDHSHSQRSDAAALAGLLQPRHSSSACAAGARWTTRVAANARFRLRLISHSTNTPYYFTIDNHVLAIVEVDGVEIAPIRTTRVYMNPGQRYSVLVDADQTPGIYRMRAVVATHCFHLAGHHGMKEHPHEDEGLPNIGFEGSGLLVYGTRDLREPPRGEAWDVEREMVPAAGEGEQETKEPWKARCHDLPFGVPKPLRQMDAYEVGEGNYHYFTYRMHRDGEVYRTFINKTVSVPLTDDATLWTAFRPSENGSSVDAPRHAGSEVAPSPSPWNFGSQQRVLVSEDPRMGAQIVVNSLHMMSHPWHLHGQPFQVVGWGKDKFGKGKTKWNLNNPMRRDTLTVPGDSHVILRIDGVNPGIWALHCHILWHAEGGMFISIAQGMEDLRTMLDELDVSAAARGEEGGGSIRQKFCFADPSRPALPEESG